MSKKILVLPAKGIGDGLLMMIIAENFLKNGFGTCIWHSALCPLKSWFSGHAIEPQKPLEAPLLDSFEKIIVQNDNSQEVQGLIRLRSLGQLPSLTVLYPTHHLKKHGTLHPNDRVFDTKKSMAENLCLSAEQILNEKATTHNGIHPPHELQMKRFPRRILIHPFSQEEKKNWKFEQFVRLAKKLLKKGFEVAFIMQRCSPRQFSLLVEGLKIPCICDRPLTEIAGLILESGLVIGNDSFACHLASNLGIPSIVIGSCPYHLKLWKPGWHAAELVTPKKLFLKLHFFKKHWKKLIRVKKVLRAADKVFSML